MITVTPRPSYFHAAHSLQCFGADHKCANKHGHTWAVAVSFRGEPDVDGIVAPYELVPKIAARIDHCDLDKVLPFPSTGENLAEWFAGLAQSLAPEGVRVVRVELREGPAPESHVVVWEPDES